MKSANQSLALGLSACALMLMSVPAWGLPLSGVGATPMPLIQEPQAPPQAPPPDQAQQEPAKSTTFTGTVAKDGDQLVLRDSSGNVYTLDDTEQAQKFVGKQVKVTGRLDADAKMIHVDSIEGAAL